MAEEKGGLEIDDWLDDLENDAAKAADAPPSDLDQSDIDALLGEDGPAQPLAAIEGGAGGQGFAELDQSDIDSLLSGSQGASVSSPAPAGDGGLNQSDIDDLFAAAPQTPLAGRGVDVPSQDDVDQLFARDGKDLAEEGLETVGFSQVADSAGSSVGVAAGSSGFDEDEFDFGELPEIPDETTAGRGSAPSADAGEESDATRGLGNDFADLLSAATDDGAEAPPSPPASPPAGGRKLAFVMPAGMTRKVAAIAGGLLLLVAGAGYFLLGGEGEKEEAVPLSLQEKELASRTVGQPEQKPLPPNAPPEVADAQLQMAQAGEALSIEIKGEDKEGDALRYEIVTQPRYGRLSGEAPFLTYLPGPDFPGEDSFEFRAHDPQQSSALARVVILGPEEPTKLTGAGAEQPTAPAGEIPPEKRLVGARDARLRTLSTAALVIDWKKIWARANTHPFDSGVKVEILDQQMQGTLSRLDQARHRYVPDRYFSGTEELRYRFHQQGRKSKIRKVVIQVALGDFPPQLHIQPMARAYKVGESVVIDASQTRDDSPDTLHFRWEQISGVAVQMEPMNEEGSVVSFVMPSSFSRDSRTVIRVTAIDRGGQRASRDLSVGGISRRQSPLWGISRQESEELKVKNEE